MSVILSAAKGSRRIPRGYLKALASGSLGPSRTGIFARDDGASEHYDFIDFFDATCLDRRL